ncbi:hypothetical protein Tco_0764228, partial [Tanacetum coccineum]
GKLRDRNTKESWALLDDLALYDNESSNDLGDFAKPVKVISLPQDVSSTSDRRLIELENQVQHLMESHLAPKQPIQVNKITSSCEICSGPYDIQYCMENTEQAFVNYASLRTDEAKGKWYTFKPEQKNLGGTYNPSWKSHPNLSEMTNKIDTVLKAITDRMAGVLSSDTVKNPKLNVKSTSLVSSTRSYPMKDPQCSTQIHGSINTIMMYLKQPYEPHGHDIITKVEKEEEPKDTPQKGSKGPKIINELEYNRIKEEKEFEWLNIEEPLDLVDTCKESVYESLIKKIPRCSLNFDFRIKKGNPNNLKFPCMIG